MIHRSFIGSLTVAAVVLGAVAVIAGQTAGSAALKNPASLKETSPAKYTVTFDTSAGAFVVEVQRAWAPNGADRFYNLVKAGYYDECRFFRVIENFMVQFGINGDPAVNAVWQGARIPADAVKQSNRRGFITFAMGGSPDTRTTQVFINFKDNAFLDQSGFAPFGKVTSGMNVVDKLYKGTGKAPRAGRGRNRDAFRQQGTRI